MLILFSAALFGFGLLLFSLGLAVMLLGLAIRIAIWLFQLGLLLLTGILLLAAAPAHAHYDLPKGYLDAVADAVGDYCVHHFCQPGIATQEAIPNWWTPRGTGTYWDWNAPTLADAPSWLKYPIKQHSWRTVGRVRRSRL
jgi:hypothetical protein